MADYGLRNDGTQKGRGYLGEVTSRSGVMTEYTIGVEIGGVEMDIPTIVPTLTRQELMSMQLLGRGYDIPHSVVQKAVDHAVYRMHNGRSVFAEDSDDDRTAREVLHKRRGLRNE